MRLQVCEKMGWTFEEFDRTPAEDIFVAMELWRLEALREKQTKRRKK